MDFMNNHAPDLRAAARLGPELPRHQRSAFDRNAFATSSVAPRELWFALAIGLISILIFAAIGPFSRVPLPHVPAFIPSYESAMIIADFVTAALLFGRVNRRGSIAMLVLGGGYFFNAAIVVLHVLSFPGAFSTTGLLGANDQTTAWLFLFWHGGFPLFVLFYALLPESKRYSLGIQKRSGPAIAWAVAGAVGLALACLLMATAGHNLLPRVIANGNYSLMMTTGATPAVLTLTTMALLALRFGRPRTALNLWLLVVLGAWLLDVLLSAVISSSRYDLGWYGGRIYSLISACCLLVVLLAEMNRLHGRLMEALATAGTLQEHLTFRAENDSLTGLPNRALFYDRLETAMTRCRRSKNLMALLYIDVDKFKSVNDDLGHATGDELLKVFAQRLQNCVRASDTVARLGGDEFTVILENIASAEATTAVVEKLMDALRAPYIIAGRKFVASASIGIASYAGGDLEADGLIRQADIALYQAKDSGRNGYRNYESDQADDSPLFPSLVAVS